ncbi:thioredoxin [Prochlorothrix hollandica]|uniref:Thioredoxin n=1 Tax=Prochlorothrix hollandica PCC 9006 = CALU 1027 TaxID=317619 RepID=A0A0M2Q1J9_PROHO|nr:thioredoxin [Prochlorothrix hollandica]KKJ00819.1 thioredoxin [Prochlorothrix hollandica PCC 9006 = CALU 1027]
MTTQTGATFIENEAEFDTLLTTNTLMVVDCTATWCGPCKIVAPLMDKLCDEYRDRAQVYKLDLDTNKDLAKRYQVRSIPAVLFFKDGELMETAIGVKPYDDFKETLEKYL